MAFFDQFHSILPDAKKKKPVDLPLETPASDGFQTEVTNRPMEPLNEIPTPKFDPYAKSPEYSESERAYEDAVSMPAQKQPLWKQVLFVGLQGLRQAATGDFSQPIELLGNAKKAENIRQAGQRYLPLRKKRDDEIAEGYRQKQIENIDFDNATARAESARKSQADANRSKYYDGILRDRARGRELTATQIEDLRGYREWLMQNGDKNTEAKIRQIDERLKDYDLDREEKVRHNKVTEGQGQARVDNQRAAEGGRAERAQQRLAGMSERQRTSAIEGAVQKWITQNKGATPEQIAETRKRLIELYGK